MNLITKLHSDFSHGWLKVPIEFVRKIGIRVSAYSYADHRFAYLEEDLDAPNFIAAMEEAGNTVEWTEVYDGESSPIRNLPSYRSMA